MGIRNIFVGQEHDVRAELQEICSVKQNIMSPQSTKNLLCITQDSLLGSYLMTKDDQDLGRDLFFDLCMKGDHYHLRRVVGESGWSSSYILEGLSHISKVMKENGYTHPLYCGKNIFSLMFPRDLTYTKKTEGRKDQPLVKVVRGVLLEGALTKTVLGQAHNSLIHHLYTQYGDDLAMGFLNNSQFIPNQFMTHHSFTVGIQDCVSKVSDRTEEIAYTCFLEAKDIEGGVSHPALREIKIVSALERSRERGQKMAKDSVSATNSFIATVTSGSRGEWANITQIMSMLGQTQLQGKRIPKTFNRGKRSLPHYPEDGKGELTLQEEFESRGFISHSFAYGLSPHEFIWHAMAGREGCVNTSLNTAFSGYTSRKLTKLVENFQVRYGGTVSGDAGIINSWAYGGDGFDRNNMAFKRGKVMFCDIEALVERLNNEWENSLN